MLSKFNYSKIIEMNSKFESSLFKNKIKIKILSNITCFQLKEYLQFQINQKNFNAKVDIGEFNNLFDQHKDEKNNFVIVIWELANISVNSHYQLDKLNKNDLEKIIENTKKKIDLFLKLNKKSTILFNKFSSKIFKKSFKKSNNLEKTEKILNQFLINKKLNNLILIDIDELFFEVGSENLISLRDFYLTKSLYNLKFYEKYSSLISDLILSKISPKKKVIVLDCDNTLWGGVLVEDGINKIKINQNDYPGNIYQEVQSLLLDFYNKGVLLCLNTKNNIKDVKEVFKKNSILKFNHFIDSQCNWNDKVSNLKKISKNLNLGLESFIFIDDSDFEINHVKKSLPEVTCVKVPTLDLYTYPSLIKNLSKITLSNSLTDEDKKKNEFYKLNKKRQVSKNTFKNLDDYINSLNIQIRIKKNNHNLCDRVTQLTQKTNQFNSSLNRYTESQIYKIIKDKNYHVFTGQVIDKFGDNGVTLACILKSKNKELILTDFIMSCRVFGRNLEHFFLNFIEKKFFKKSFKEITIKFKIGQKNYLVKNFLNNYGFILKKKSKDYLVYKKNCSTKLNPILKQNKIKCIYE